MVIRLGPSSKSYMNYLKSDHINAKYVDQETIACLKYDQIDSINFSSYPYQMDDLHPQSTRKMHIQRGQQFQNQNSMTVHAPSLNQQPMPSKIDPSPNQVIGSNILSTSSNVTYDHELSSFMSPIRSIISVLC